MRFLRPQLLVALSLALGAMATGLRATPVHADYGRAIYQITISTNCDNPSACDGLGGFWGWAALNADGIGNAEFAGCGHTVGGGGPGLAGAGHTDEDFTWVPAPSNFLPGVMDAFFTSETDTFTGHGTPQTFTTQSEYVDQFPLAPGHYSTAQVFGMQAPPGVSFQLQVTYIPPK